MMKQTLTSLALVALAGSIGRAQSPVRLAVSPDSKLSIEGTSNLHGWECKASTIDAIVTADPEFKDAVDFPKLLKTVQVKIPVTSLKCGHGGMDKNLYKALKSDAEPQIRYSLGSVEAVKSEGSSYTLSTVGTLEIAGKENTVKIDVTASRLANGTVKAVGSVPVLMTEYGIQPPTAMFGTLKTGDKVTVQFELLVSPQTIVAAARP